MLEAVVVFANEILVCFLFPIHAGAHRVYHLFTTVIHNGAAPLFRLPRWSFMGASLGINMVCRKGRRPEH